jgi:hypothetical protein
MARLAYKGFDLPDGNEVPDVPTDLKTLVDGVAPRYAPALYSATGIAFTGSAGGTINTLTIPAAPYARACHVFGMVRCDGNSGSGSAWIADLRKDGVAIRSPQQDGGAFAITFWWNVVFTLGTNIATTLTAVLIRNAGAGLVTGYADPKTNVLQAMVYPTQLTS